MKTFNQEETTKRFTKLPENVQELILSDEISDAIGKVTESAHITGEKKQECIQQITLVSVGLSTTKDFHEYVHTTLNLPEEIATSFEDQVTQDIFHPIKRTLLRALENINSNSKAPLPENYTTNPATHNSSDPYKEP